MSEAERQKERLRLEELDPRVYYDYERRFVKQKLEQDRIGILPRVVKPPMFARGGHALGDLRVFERYSVGPLTSLTCSFLDIQPGERTDRQRMIPSNVVYILEGDGECIQDEQSHRFAAEDVVVIPPYTTHQFVGGSGGFRAWVPEVRLWHVLGLLWQEQFEFKSVPEGTRAVRKESAQLAGFRVPRGVLGLRRDLEVRAGPDKKREQLFAARRAIREAGTGSTKYDGFLRMMVEENEREQIGPRVVRGEELEWERTRQGRLKFYVTPWTDVAAKALCVMVQEIEPGGHSGMHRHIFEEMLLVSAGVGHDVHEETRYAWQAGDLICVPPMTAHQHCNDGETPARLISAWPQQLTRDRIGGIEHISDASGWGIRD